MELQNKNKNMESGTKKNPAQYQKIKLSPLCGPGARGALCPHHDPSAGEDLIFFFNGKKINLKIINLKIHNNKKDFIGLYVYMQFKSPGS